MPVDVTAILVSSTFMGAGLALAKFFPESSLLAAFFLGGLALVNIALSLAGWSRAKRSSDTTGPKLKTNTES